MTTKLRWSMRMLLQVLPVVFVANLHADRGVATQTASLDSRDYQVVVVSDYGFPEPGVGTHANFCWQSVVTCSVGSNTVVDGVAGVRYISQGWAGTGSAPPTGEAATTGEFTLTNVVSTVTWLWQTEFLLTVDVQGGSGTTSVVSAWYPAGTNIQVTATADAGWRFDHWLVDGAMPSTGAFDNPIELDMEEPRTLSAVLVVLDLAEALDNFELVWRTGGSGGGWFAQTAESYDGVDAARSGAMGDRGTNWLETVVYGSGTLSFRWKVSSEVNYDFLRFLVDGEERASISGETEWAEVSVWIDGLDGFGGLGAPKLRWEYAKDKSLPLGDEEDCGWVDQVVWTPDFSPLSVAVDATHLDWDTGGDSDWFAQTADTYDGTHAVRSGPLPSGDLLGPGYTYPEYGTNWLSTTVSGPGIVSFWWKVSSEEGYDYLRFLVDGTEITKISGTNGWSAVVLRVDGEGNHELRWEYTKDKSHTEGDDCGWIDQFVWTPLVGFSLWADQDGLAGESGELFVQETDGIPNGFRYAFGENLPADGLLLTILSIGGRMVVQTPLQAAETLAFVEVQVIGSTNLVDWDLTVPNAVDTTGKPSNCGWYEPTGAVPGAMFFRLKATLK